MTSRKTCDKCKHYSPSKDNQGSCGHTAVTWAYDQPELPLDGIWGGGYDGYGDYIVMGPKFGCIHWEKK